MRSARSRSSARSGSGAALAGATVVFVDPATARGRVRAGRHGRHHLGAGGRRALRAAARGPARSRRGGVGRPARRWSPGTRCATQSTASILTVLGFITTFLLVFAGISLFVGGVHHRQHVLHVGPPADARARAAAGGRRVPAAGVHLDRAAGRDRRGGRRGPRRRGRASASSSCCAACSARSGMELTGQVPLDGFTIVVSVLVGTLVSVLAAALPARRAALVPPVEALRDEVTAAGAVADAGAPSSGIALVVPGVAAVVVRAARPDRATTRERCSGYGAGAVVLGVLAASPVLARGILRRGSPSRSPRGGPVGRLARGQRHAQPAPHREHRGRPDDRHGPRGCRRGDRGDHPGVDQRDRHAGGHHRLHPARRRAGHGAGAGDRRRPRRCPTCGRPTRSRPPSCSSTTTPSPITGIDPDASAAASGPRWSRATSPPRSRPARSPCSGPRWTTRTGRSGRSSSSSARRAQDAHDRRRHRLARVRGAVRRRRRTCSTRSSRPTSSASPRSSSRRPTGADVAALRDELTAAVRPYVVVSVMDSEEFVSRPGRRRWTGCS